MQEKMSVEEGNQAAREVLDGCGMMMVVVEEKNG